MKEINKKDLDGQSNFLIRKAVCYLSYMCLGYLAGSFPYLNKNNLLISILVYMSAIVILNNNDHIYRNKRDNKIQFIFLLPFFTLLYFFLGIYIGQINNGKEPLFTLGVTLLSFITLVIFWMGINYYRWKRMK